MTTPPLRARTAECDSTSTLAGVNRATTPCDVRSTRLSDGSVGSRTQSALATATLLIGLQRLRSISNSLMASTVINSSVRATSNTVLAEQHVAWLTITHGHKYRPVECTRQVLKDHVTTEAVFRQQQSHTSGMSSSPPTACAIRTVGRL